MNYNEKREFQGIVGHAHVVAYVKDTPKIYENSDEEVNAFISKYITHVLFLADFNKPNLRCLFRKVQVYHHTTACKKKKDITYRFNEPWSPSANTSIVYGGKVLNAGNLKETKHLIDTILSTTYKDPQRIIF